MNDTVLSVAAVRAPTEPILPDVVLPSVTVEFVFDTALSGRNANTIRAYHQTLDDFAAFLKATDALSALRTLLSQTHGVANALAESYKISLVQRGMASATVARHLGAIRSIVKDARRFGLVPWALEVRNVPSRQVRDTRGPGF